MSLFELPIENYEHQEPVPEGEYELQIYSADDSKPASTGRAMVTCMLTILNPPVGVTNPAPIFHRVFGIMEDDPPNTVNMMLGSGLSFKQVFSLSDFGNPLTWAGATGKCLVVMGEDQNGNPQNELKLPRPRKD